MQFCNKYFDICKKYFVAGKRMAAQYCPDAGEYPNLLLKAVLKLL